MIWTGVVNAPADFNSICPPCICSGFPLRRWLPLLNHFLSRSGLFQPHFFLTGQKETVSTRQRKTPVSRGPGRTGHGSVGCFHIYLVTRPAGNVGRFRSVLTTLANVVACLLILFCFVRIWLRCFLLCRCVPLKHGVRLSHLAVCMAVCLKNDFCTTESIIDNPGWLCYTQVSQNEQRREALT